MPLNGGGRTLETALSQHITDILKAWQHGDAQALDQLMPVVYGELRRQAQGYLRGERTGHSLSASDLINDAYARLVDARRVDWRDRAHFFGAAAGTMRRILVDHARRHCAKKRGDRGHKVSLDSAVLIGADNLESVLAVHEALDGLAVVAPQRARVVELRFFGGSTEEEIAEVLGISPRTVRREWQAAKAWLFRALTSRDDR